LAPLAGKFFHHHDEEVIKLHLNQHIQYLKLNCPICNFEYFTFSNELQQTDHQIIQFSEIKYFASYLSPLIEPGIYSFLLRAPPVKKKLL
jgi:hypothetical protein